MKISSRPLLFLILFFVSFISSLEATLPQSKPCEKQKDFIYVPLQEIMAGQPEISQEAVELVAADLLKPGFYQDEKTHAITYCYDHGKSPFNKAFKVVALPTGLVPQPFRYLLVDGHHTILGTLLNLKNNGMSPEALRYVTLSVVINEQYKTLSAEKFWEVVAQKGLVYPEKGTGRLTPRHILDVPNNDMRGLIEQTLSKCSEVRPITYSNTEKKTLWLKVGGENPHTSIPFIEFYIAEILKKEGVPYKKGDPITEAIVAQARDALLKHTARLKEKGILVVVPAKDKLQLHNSHMTPEDYCRKVVGAPQAAK